MSEFDSKARDWDKNKVHVERAEAIATELLHAIPVTGQMTALEFGGGTGLLSFILKDRFAHITLVDSSKEMVRVTREKIEAAHIKHMHAKYLDLERDDYKANFDVIFNQMVLHHVVDIDLIFKKFYALLNPGGFLAIADLYTEDGTFHGPDAKVHHGFDPEILTEKLKSLGFKLYDSRTCFVMKHESGKEFPIFLLVVRK